jgi:hypothetical protein
MMCADCNLSLAQMLNAESEGLSPCMGCVKASRAAGARGTTTMDSKGLAKLREEDNRKKGYGVKQQKEPQPKET